MEQAERKKVFSQAFVIEAQGLLILDEDMSEKDWIELGKEITNRREGSTWALGDWLVFGGRQVKNQNQGRWTGSGYAEAAKITGYDPSHLVNAYKVSKSFPLGTRVEGVKWSLHRIALTLPTIDRSLSVLREAKKMGWIGVQLHEHIRTLLPARAFNKPAGQYKHVEVICPSCKHRFAVKGNKAK